MAFDAARTEAAVFSMFITAVYPPPGAYTIIAESDGPGALKWGQLKSKEGWIALDYAKKI